MSKKRIRPLPGRAFVKLRSRHRIREQLIWIPEVGLRVRGLIAECMDRKLWRSEKPAYIYEHGSLVLHNAPWKMNAQFADMIGKNVILDAGTFTELNTGTEILHVVRFEHIAAILPKDSTVTVMESFDPERCPRCPSGGEANILMDSDGYCPQCGLDALGNPRPTRTTLADEEVWAMATPAEKLILQRVHKIGPSPRVKGRVYFDMGGGK